MTDDGTWSDAPYIFMTLPGCHYCGHSEFIITKTVSQSDGSKLRKCLCSNCSKKNRIVVELPNPGNSADDDLYS